MPVPTSVPTSFRRLTPRFADPRSRRAVAALAFAATACGAAVRVAPPAASAPASPAAGARADGAYVLPPADAFQRGLMPLASTGVPLFLRDHPTWDGRGVLIAILDSGIDPGQGGFGTTTDGDPKLLDLRDFSGEGRIALRRVTPVGDSVTVAGHTLGGFGRMRTLDASGPWYGGVLAETPLGDAPASDVNWNGVVGDTLVVVVGRASDGWVLLTDTDGDGSLRNEHPVHDYLVAREMFGWAPAGHPVSLTVAANFSEDQGAPRLDLFFDTSGHGTHVAGIAAGHDLYDIPGFNGVAPGAALVGIKIADDANGGISVTGSILHGLDYAIRFAAARHLPLVVNLSFGVGNEREGAAAVDRLVDSVLALHPGVVMTVSAGNDGPGVSTLGFPGSARRVISVGASLPAAFFSRGAAAPDVLAFFSSRGGEVAGPALVAPGVAYSSVPRWHRGSEVLQGTSMASPHVAGLAALLVSALTERKRPIESRLIRQALMTTAQPLAGFTDLDQGAGLPEVSRAWAWLAGRHPYPDIEVSATAPLDGSTTGALRPAGLRDAGDTLQEFLLSRPTGDSTPVTLTFRSPASWLVPPAPVTLGAGPMRVTVRYRRSELVAPGLYADQVTGWGSDSLAGPLVRLDNAVVVPLAATSFTEPAAPLAPAAERRWFFSADSSRPFRVQIATTGSREVVGAFLHEPGGMPFRGGHELEGSSGSDAAVFQVDARDALSGIYEADAVAPPSLGSSAGIRLAEAPFQLLGRRDRDGVTARLVSLAGERQSVHLAARLIGAQRGVTIFGTGGAPVTVTFTIPPWARSAQIDFLMDRAQWERFTDFGMTLFDSAGHQLGQSPLNYAMGRMEVELQKSPAPVAAHVTLFPGLATAADSATWNGAMLIRLYADPDSAVALPPKNASSQPVELGPHGESSATFPMLPLPWTLGDAFVPLGLITAQVGDGPVWTRELPLPAPSGPLMR